MKAYFLPLLFLASIASANTRISDLPLDAATEVGPDDSFPVVNSTSDTTERILLDDLINIPGLATPVFTGPIKGPSIILGSGASTGYLLTSTDTLGHAAWVAPKLPSPTPSGDLLFANGAAWVAQPVPTWNQSTTGNAATATALAATPSQCSGVQVALGIGSTGTANCSNLPNPAVASLGGIESFAAVTHQWIRQISTSGVPTASQPAFSDISSTLDLTTQVVNALPIANGGTNGATKLAGFDNLSPLSAKGDLLTYSGSHNVNLAVGSTTGYVLTVNPSATNGLDWENPASGNLVIWVTKTTNYTVTSSDSGIICGTATAANFNLTMPAASTVSGLRYYITNNSNYVVTLLPNGSDTIYLNSSQTLAAGASVLLISDGSTNYNAF